VKSGHLWPRKRDLILIAGFSPAQLRYGAEKRHSPRLSAQLDSVLGALEILPFEKPADAALALRYTLVTDNEKESSRVQQLRLENWLR